MITITYDEILAKVATLGLKVSFDGNKGGYVKGFCSINNPKDSCITWIKKPEIQNMDNFSGIKRVLLVASKKVEVPVNDCSFILTDEPKAVFFSILEAFWHKEIQKCISETSVVESNALAKNISIGHHCYIGADVVIGENTIIENNVTIINPVVIGENCLIHSGVVIGSDGFGFFVDENGQPQKVKHFGGVSIGNNVEIGANTCIDRGTIDNTIIEDNVKIDNLCHIAHNTYIGKNSMIVADAVICGSAKLEERSYVAPGGIIRNQLHLGKNAFVGLGAVVTESVDDNMVVAGIPAKPIRMVEKWDK